MAGGGGFGSLDSMIKTIKNNASLLRRKSMFQVIKEGGDFKRKKPYQYKKASQEELDGIRNNVIERNKKASYKKAVVFTITALVIGLAGYFMFAGSYSIKEYIPKAEYYKIKTETIDNDNSIQIYYFDLNHKASEEHLKYGKQDGQSLSWYPTGELFRTAQYRSGGLMHEIYYYPSGGEIEDFNKRFKGDPVKVKLLDRGMKKLEFYVSDGKIIPNTFEISSQ